VTDADPQEFPARHQAPPGHSRAGHTVHGWCSLCPGREPWEELVAWRARYNASTDASTTPDKALPESREVSRYGNS